MHSSQSIKELVADRAPKRPKWRPKFVLVACVKNRCNRKFKVQWDEIKDELGPPCTKCGSQTVIAGVIPWTTRVVADGDDEMRPASSGNAKPSRKR